MASNYTEHYKLNQWELSDSVVMAEFNADNAKIEQALLDLKASLPKFQSGTFTTTKEHTKDVPCTLTFNFPPQLVIIVPETKVSTLFGPALLLQGVTKSVCQVDPSNYTEFRTEQLYLTWEGNSVSFGTGNNAIPIATYHYLAIG